MEPIVKWILFTTTIKHKYNGVHLNGITVVDVTNGYWNCQLAIPTALLFMTWILKATMKLTNTSNFYFNLPNCKHWSWPFYSLLSVNSLSLVPRQNCDWEHSLGTRQSQMAAIIWARVYLQEGDIFLWKTEKLRTFPRKAMWLAFLQRISSQWSQWMGPEWDKTQNMDMRMPLLTVTSVVC